MAEATLPTDITVEVPKSTKPENMPWYMTELKEEMVDPAARELFENYCKIPSADVISHIKQFVRSALEPQSFITQTTC